MIALYRKYRPQNFNQIFGQTDVKITLQNAILTNRIVHSYLFSGPRGTGKTTMARVFAKALNCENRKPDDFEPCNQCYTCTSINEGSFVDLIEIDAASNRKIEDIRNLQELIRFAPRKSNGYKIFILDESHMLTKEAANAFLKTLEEPPHNVIFILATTDPQKMIPTILSRVQHFNFTPLSADDIYNKLSYILEKEEISLDKQILNQIINTSMGGARDAESTLGKILSYKKDIISTEIAEMIIGKNTYQASIDTLTLIASDQIPEALKNINLLANSGYDMNDFSNNLIKNTHNLFLLSISKNLINTNLLLKEDQDLLTNLAKQKDTQFWANLLSSLDSRKELISKSYLAQIPLEIAIAENTLFKKNMESVSNNTNIDFINTKNISPNPTKTIDSKSLEPKSTAQQEKVKIKIPEPELIPKTSQGYDNPFRAKNAVPTSKLEVIEELPGELTIYTIKQKFDEIKQILNRKFKTFIPIIKVADPLEYKDNILTISLPTVFYKNRLTKLSPEIEITLKDIFKQDIKVECIITSEPKTPFQDDITNKKEDTPSETQNQIIDLENLNTKSKTDLDDKKIVSIEDVKEKFKDFL